jgi:aquaporin Z
VRRYVTELIGTLALVLTIGCTVKGAPEGVVAPLAVGAVLVAMVCAGGPLSGGHYNPAVSLAVAIRGRLGWKDLPLYWVAQVLGAVLGALAANYLVDLDKNAPSLEGRDIGATLLAEFLFAFLLTFVVLHVTRGGNPQGDTTAGLAAGFVLVAGMSAVGAYDAGAAFNPAAAVGGLLLDTVAGGSLWIYLLATLGAGAAAALTFKALHPEGA